MPSGPNEHHIPQFLQRPFGVKPKGKRPTEIWLYARGAEPELGPIDETAAEDYFYGKELDEKLKPPESALGARFATLRTQAIGSSVDAALAADLITHLAPRSKHLRSTLESGLRHLVVGARELFGDEDKLATALGLDGDQPNDRFEGHMQDLFEREPIFANLGLPLPVVQRIAFFIAKEQPSSLATDTVAMFGNMLANWSTEAPEMAKDGHVRALGRFLEEPNVRRDLLASFDWTVEPAPSEGAVLPDCIALAHAPDAPVLPIMYAGKQMHAVAMPLTTDKLLVGRAPSTAHIDIGDFNADAAACSQDFFLAHADLPSYRVLSDKIGTRADAFFREATQSVVCKFLPDAVGEDDIADEPGAVNAKDERLGSYDVQCFDFGDQEQCQRVADALAPIIASVSKFLPLQRLEGVTFAIDVAAALHAFDCAQNDKEPDQPSDLPSVSDTGVIYRIMREGRMTARLFFGVPVIECLLSDDEAAVEWKLQWIIHQLAHVALLELVDRALPDAAATTVDGELPRFLWEYARWATHTYVAARLSGYFGGGAALAAVYRDHLIEALSDFRSTLEIERAAYLEHRNADPLTTAAGQKSAQVLGCASALLAHCESSGEPVHDEGGRLATALTHANLIHWLGYYGRQLEAFFGRLGRWKSIDEFLVFNQHVERLFWSVALFVWEKPEGMWVQAGLSYSPPASTDADPVT